MSTQITTGIEKAWQTLGELDPATVCRNTGAAHNPETGCYTLISLGTHITIDPARKVIEAERPEDTARLRKLGYFTDHAILWYMVSAKDIGLARKLVKPNSLRGGHHFFTGTHELPLGAIAGKYGENQEAFVARAVALGGKPIRYGDAGVELYPLPRIPITVILWLSDDEFPARADLLFDSSCELHVALDINWSVAMYTLLSML